MSFTHITDSQSIQAHQDSHFRRPGSGRGARAESSLTVLSRALRRARREEEGSSRHGMP